MISSIGPAGLRTRVAAAFAALVTAAGLAAAPSAPALAKPSDGFTNPVTAGVVDTFPDPAIIKAKDGLWYAYGTTNGVFNDKGDTRERILPVVRSADMVNWSFVGEVFTFADRPSWWPSGTRPWAPDIRYVDGVYHLTYSLSTGGVGLATSPSAAGPWTDRGRLIPAGGSGCPTGNIDQSLFTDVGGQHYLYWGSYDTICVAKTNADATALVGPVTQIARGRRAEGGYVVRRDGWYYLFYSDGGCCDGAFSGYTVKVGRADNPLGPFVTPSGLDLMDLTSKDGIVLASNGDTWAGPGHNSFQTDLSGQDWLVYHAIPTANPDLPPVTGPWGGTLNNLSRRPMLIDRLDWIDGWPVVRAGAGPSSTRQQAPVTEFAEGGDFNGQNPLSGWFTDWKIATDPDAGGHLASPASGASLQLAKKQVKGDVRIEGDLRLGTGTGGAAGLVVAHKNDKNSVIAWIDRARGLFTVATTIKGVTTEQTAPLPAGFAYTAWHNVAVERRGNAITAALSADRLRDPVAEITLTLPSGAPDFGRIGAATSGGRVDADNLGAADLYKPVTQRAPEPQPGTPLTAHSDEFDGTGRPEVSDAAWSWIRGEKATAAVTGGGVLTWPTQAAELYRNDNSASVLLRDAPDGDFLVETKLTFDGRTGNQQAGIVLYENDNRFFKLAHSILPLQNGGGAFLHQTEFNKEAERLTATPPEAVYSGPMFGGPATSVLWLRLAYTVVDGENRVRAASSTDGTHWTWAGAWSTPYRTKPRIGLVSMNAAGATAQFDYVRTFRLAGS
ncbi:family 43 glycosylhydrolase [Actinocorallia sp. A-T 12471]|uniref:family 43 glycosylhydrolase n=1 Tax=Actinocorallia sp. A-T 12471 TaxID=3089813 RepID=UPI0029CFEAC4|nr:family 43 glycosylhydrolase [Actinocorallia sp. A-T 12471]MDX6740368.1 family 43 glycosylhydrolase [Actinocorallia sp. A-T 12471]